MPQPRRGRPPKKSTLERTGQTSFMEVLANSAEARANLRSMLAASKIDTEWRGMVATPPGSFLETMLEAFKERTDIPLEIPFFSSMHFISQHLLSKNITINFLGNLVKPDLWNVILAPSGSSKTYTISSIRKVLDEDVGLPEPSSAAKFIELLQEFNNGGWVQDEFGKFLSGLELPQLLEMKGYLLKLYDGDRIERNTMKKSVVIDNPALAILGLTVLETFIDELPDGSLLDGFAQRFNYIIAKKDPRRTIRDFPIYSLEGYDEKLKRQWDELRRTIANDSEYIVNQDGVDAYVTAFRNMLGDADLDDSFYRRVLWRGVRYALIYHILLGKTSNTIDAVDMAWACRVIQMHLRDASELLTQHAMPEIGRILDRCAEVREKLLKEEGRDIKPRDLVQRVHGIKNVNEAKVYLDLLR